MEGGKAGEAEGRKVKSNAAGAIGFRSDPRNGPGISFLFTRSMPDPQIPEAVVSLVNAVCEDDGICEFIFKFEKFSDAVRRKAFKQMAAQLRAAGEDEEVAAALAMLCDPHLYHAACDTLREFRSE